MSCDSVCVQATVLQGASSNAVLQGASSNAVFQGAMLLEAASYGPSGRHRHCRAIEQQLPCFYTQLANHRFHERFELFVAYVYLKLHRHFCSAKCTCCACCINAVPVHTKSQFQPIACTQYLRGNSRHLLICSVLTRHGSPQQHAASRL